jgi:hypothetical protein
MKISPGVTATIGGGGWPGHCAPTVFDVLGTVCCAPATSATLILRFDGELMQPPTGAGAICDEKGKKHAQLWACRDEAPVGCDGFRRLNLLPIRCWSRRRLC